MQVKLNIKKAIENTKYFIPYVNIMSCVFRFN